MAAPSSTIEFLDLVRRSGIVRTEVLDKLVRTPTTLPSEPAKCAVVLIRDGLLTKFQAKLLLAGRYRGFRLGPYVVLNQIGQGGMGAVYLAEHQTLRRKVAIKVLAQSSAGAPLGVERFMREARAAAALDHPNIVRIFDVATHGDSHYLVMEYVDGETLETLLRRAGALPCGRVVAFVTQALAGLQHAYEKGFVHRDIKPGNLMLSREGTIKILDMGLARSFNDPGDKLTEVMDQGAVVGTADYIAPEQALNSPDVDIRADIYSLGATFFALATGDPPFAGNTTQKLTQHQLREIPPLNEVDQTFPNELAQVVARMTKKNPDDRYQTPAEVIAALAPWVPDGVTAKVMAGLSNTGIGTNAHLQSTLTEMVSRTTGRLPRPATTDGERAGLSDRWPVVVAGIIAVLLVGVGAMVYLLSTPDPVRLGIGETAENQTTGTAPPPPDQAVPKAKAKTTPKKAPKKKAPKPASKSNPKIPDDAPPEAAPGPRASPAALTETVGLPVFRFDPSGFRPFRFTVSDRKSNGDRPRDPTLQMHCWKAESVAEFHGNDEPGGFTIGVTNLNDTLSSQILFLLQDADAEPDAEYVARLEYRTVNEAAGILIVRGVKYANLGQAPLPGTGGQWHTVEVRFRRPAGPTLDAVIENRTAGEGNTLAIRKFEVLRVK